MSARDVRVILASAGSGKTWQLTTHFLRRLALGVSPDRILAATFTRKAAGEILGRVLARLAGAAARDDERRAMDVALELGEHGREFYLDLLARCVGDVQRFRVRTLDAFFVELAQAFAPELGLPPRWAIAEELATRRARAAAVSAAFERRPVRDWSAWLAELERAQAARGVHETLMRTVRDAHGLAQDSDASAWGRLDPLPALDHDAVGRALERLERAPLASKKNGERDGRWAKELARFADAVVECDWSSLAAKGFGSAVITGANSYYGNDMALELVDAVAALLRHAASAAAHELAQQTRAARRVLDEFDAEYTREQARSGGLAFDDLPRALARHAATSSSALDEIALRLGARTDHVLLDEFQDTSPAQWRALQPLVAELAHRATGSRSVFVVGDVKQSIYGWRWADPGLLERLPDELGAEAMPLDRSFRSAQTVLDGVNRVFGGLAANPALAQRETAVSVAQRFVHSFRAHTAVHGYRGEVHVHTCAAGESSDESYEHALACAVDIVLDVHARAPAATIALLLRRRQLIPRLVYLLRQRGLVASGESGNQLGDSAAVQVVLSLLHLIDHPGDSAALFHVATTPLGPELGLRFDVDRAAVRRAVHGLRTDIARRGLPDFLERLRPVVLSGFGAWDARRFGQLVDVSLAWPEAASLRVADFVERAREQAIDDSSAAQIKVMTIHAAKGLEFDVVVAPELDLGYLRRPPTFRWRRRDDDPRQAIEAVARGTDKATRALLAFAGERTMVALDRSTEERDLRDELSALYVAMTRAVHRLDLILRPEASAKPRFSAAGIVRHAYELGDGELPARTRLVGESTNDDGWMRERSGARDVETAREPAVQRLAFRGAARWRELERASPSRLGRASPEATSELFAPSTDAARRRGSRWHAWFERIEWIEAFAERDDQLLELARTRGLGGDELERDLADFRAALERPSLRRLLAQRPSAEVWRERRFALLFGADAARPRLVSGAFDRVVVVRDGGALVAAELIDFKTDRGSSELVAAHAQRYGPQLETYRAALARITGLPASAIAARLAFAELDAVVDV